MADVLTKEQRKKNMQHIRANDTKIEVRLGGVMYLAFPILFFIGIVFGKSARY